MKLKLFKSVLKKAIAAVAILLCLVVGIACGNISASTSSNHLYFSATTSTVYITPHGKCYHSTCNCPTLSRSKNVKAVDKTEAMKSRRACKVCL